MAAQYVTAAKHLASFLSKSDHASGIKSLVYGNSGNAGSSGHQGDVNTKAVFALVSETIRCELSSCGSVVL